MSTPYSNSRAENRRRATRPRSQLQQAKQWAAELERLRAAHRAQEEEAKQRAATKERMVELEKLLRSLKKPRKARATEQPSLGLTVLMPRMPGREG